MTKKRRAKSNKKKVIVKKQITTIVNNNENKIKNTLTIIVFLDTLVSGSLWAVLPTVLDASSNASLYGIILSVASAVGLLSSTILGRLSDLIGRTWSFRIALLLIFICPFSIYLGNAIFDNLKYLIFGGALFSRIQAARSIAKAYASDLSSDDDRTTVLAIQASWMGAGFVIGPSFGGYLAEIDSEGKTALAISSIITFTNVMLSILFLNDNYANHLAKNKNSNNTKNNVKKNEKPNHAITKKNTEDTFQQASDSNNNNNLELLYENILKPEIFLLILIQFSLSFGFQSFTSSFPQYCKQRFGFGPARFGNVLSYCGCLWTITQGFIIPQLKNIMDENKKKNNKSNMSEENLLIMGVGCIFIGRLILAFAYVWPFLLLGELFVVGGAATGFTLLTSKISQLVDPSIVGTILGLLTSIESGCGIIAPPIGGYIFDLYGDFGPALVAAGSTLFGLILLLFFDGGSGGSGGGNGGENRGKKKKRE